MLKSPRDTEIKKRELTDTISGGVDVLRKALLNPIPLGQSAKTWKDISALGPLKTEDNLKDLDLFTGMTLT